MLSETLKKLRKVKDLTQFELAEKLHISPSNIAKYESKRNVMPSMDILLAMAKFFEVSMDELVGNEPPKRVSTASDQACVTIPVLGSIPAGIPMSAIEDIVDYEDIPAAMCTGFREYFALRCNGESMLPDYRPGDTLIFRKTDTCENGQDCAVMVNGEDATFKRVRILDDAMILQPLNTDFEPTVFTFRQVSTIPVRIIGVLVQVRRNINM